MCHDSEGLQGLPIDIGGSACRLQQLEGDLSQMGFETATRL